MPVAKSYLNSKIIDGPVYGRGGKQYVTVELSNGTVKTVRWYSDSEWKRMYPELVAKEKINFRDVLGFKDAGYITIYYGDTYKNLSWFKAADECIYNKLWGWYTPSDTEVNPILPDGVKTAHLNWDAICTEDGKVDEDKAVKVVSELVYEPSTSTFVGEIGERLTLRVHIDRVIPVSNQWGDSSMHIMSDEDGNVFVWTTASRTLEQGADFLIKGTVKDHRTYRNVDQTILSRCKILEKQF